MDTDVVVIGAGAVGLACGAAFARSGVDVLVLEARDGIGTGVSARNSEVVHAGMYYPVGSERARLCVQGRRKLYAYLAERGVAYSKMGKLIVATSDADLETLARIEARGVENGVDGLAMLDGAAAKAMEPELRCCGALLSPETGVFDSHGYMLALQGEIEDAGGAVALKAPVERVQQIAGGGFKVVVGGVEPTELKARRVVNSAGLYAQDVARRFEGVGDEHIPKRVLAKGNYFGCSGKVPFSRLIYPAPVEGGLGVHVTLDLGGRMRFGPDVEWLDTDNPDEVDYTVDPRRSDAFYDVIRRYWPGLPDGAITADYSGCRPKLFGPGEPAQDFRVDGPNLHGVEGVVNLFGIESPGLTSSMAIGEDVVAALS